MREIAFLNDMSRNLEGDLIVSFQVEGNQTVIDELKKLNKEKVVIEVKKYKSKRSLDANAYFWQLCDKIARKLNSDKDSIYLFMLRSAGVFVDVEINQSCFESLKRTYRLCDELQDYTIEECENTVRKKLVRCFLGSHTYNTEEMSHLINFCVEQCKDLGIETMTPEEQHHMLSLWDEKQAKMKL